MANLSDKISQGVVPISDMRSPAKAGFIQISASETIPDGWALCNGQTLNRIAYGSLFAALGTVWNTGGEAATDFRLPDFATANRYLRAADGSTLSVGDLQTDQFQGHKHNFDVARTVGVLSYGPANVSSTAADGLNTASDPVTDGVNGTPRTGLETRPISAVVNYIIKLYDDTLTISAYIPPASTTEEGIISLSSDFAATSTDYGLIPAYFEGIWTPTISASTGALTSVTGETGAYTKIGNTYFCEFSCTIVTDGTIGTGRLRVSLPVNAIGMVFGVARERTAVGLAMTCFQAGTNTTYVELTTSANDLYPGGDGYVIDGQFRFTV